MAGETRRVAVVFVVCVATGDNNVGNRLLVRADDDGDNGGDVGGDVHEHECECVCLRDGVGDKTRQFLVNILSCARLLLLLLLSCCSHETLEKCHNFFYLFLFPLKGNCYFTEQHFPTQKEKTQNSMQLHNLPLVDV